MNLTYRFFRVVARLVVWLCAPLELRHKERLPAEGPALLIGNHRSLLDGFLLIALCPRPVTFIAAAYLFRIPFVGWIVRQVAAPTGSVQGLRQALSRLETGGMVAVFPEGGVRTTDGTGNFGEIAAYLASRSGAPVIPISIRGAANVLPPGTYWPRRRPVRLTIGKPRSLPAGLKRSELLAATTAWMMEIYGTEALL